MGDFISRITKEPDVRKQEILDAAMKLFATKGYEKTTITDIARHLNISQGLCYRYFSSKDEIFDNGLEQYAEYFVDAYKSGLCDAEKSLKEKITDSSTFLDLEKEENDYYQFYHQQENKQFHSLLLLKICDKMYPVICDILRAAIEKKEICLEQPETFASFLLYGQLGILLDNMRQNTDKVEEIRAFTLTLIKQFENN